MMDKDFPKLMIKSKQQILKSPRKLSRINAYTLKKTNKNITSYIIFKSHKKMIKEKILKGSHETFYIKDKF